MGFTSAIAFIDDLVLRAYEAGASDMHLHPSEKDLIVRFRTDGTLADIASIPMRLHAEVLARIKILAQLRIDEHLLPQDGRFRIPMENGEPIDIRVSLTPTHHGEQAVLRILRSRAELATLEGLGMNDTHRLRTQETMHLRRGLILLTGPTGSGKTSTLYALVRFLNTRDTSIITIEEPVEYSVEGVTQIGVNHASGLTFSHALRSVVRQDPDVIVIGEIRDRETAALAVQAALTGHLVLSTLHTTDAPTALLRLIDLGIEPYLVASTVELVVAQRLIRKKDATGRIGIFELLRPDASLREAVVARSPWSELLEHADEAVYSPFANDCIQKVMSSLISREDITRYL